MKKVISIILVISIMLSVGTVGVVYANGNNGNNGNMNSKIQEAKDELAKVKEYCGQLRENRAEILALRSELQSAIIKLKERIETMKGEGTLTQEQIDEIKAALEQIRECRRTYIGNHRGKIGDVLRPNLQAAKRFMNYENIAETYKQICAEQEQRKADLRAIIDKINALLPVTEA